MICNYNCTIYRLFVLLKGKKMANEDLFYSQVEKNANNRKLIEEIESFSKEQHLQTYIIKKPLGDKKYAYGLEKCLVVLIPKYKISFINYGESAKDFEDYIDDFTEDLGSIADKYDFRNVIGRPKHWKPYIVNEINYSGKGKIADMFLATKLEDPKHRRNCELLISLLTGSINNAHKFNDDIPNNILDKVKQNIILFDGKQTKFIYQHNDKKRIVIQGLSGTGKTELLLHKLKDLYTNSKTSRIMFTCYSKVLANSLFKRIPDFFNFLKVEEQIQWGERLWCVGSWGSQHDVNSGAYRYICDFYNIEFLNLKRVQSIGAAATIALKQITQVEINEYGYAFDYMLIDESQDFDEDFFALCERVTKYEVYIAGDIFQTIFDRDVNKEVETDFLLSKCYRTDPKTLMFAHGLGMGLFETDKLRWLSDADLTSCGYIFKNEDHKYVVEREPLRRFEEFGDSESVEIIKYENTIQKLSTKIVEIIKELIVENPTILPDDIAIMFPNSNKELYTMIDVLSSDIGNEFDWKVNKSYESKEKMKDTVFISNKNNVKGLEFPFVICVTTKIQNSFEYRNTLYMMLTRSYIKSYLLTLESKNTGILPNIEKSLLEIQAYGRMTLNEPSIEEKVLLEEKLINYSHTELEQVDIVYKKFDDLEIPVQFRDKIQKNIESRFPNVMDEDKILQFIEQDYNLLLMMEE